MSSEGPTQQRGGDTATTPATPAPSVRISDRTILVAAIVLVVLIGAVIGLGLWVSWSPPMSPIPIESRPSA